MFILFDRNEGVMQFKTQEEINLYRKITGFDGQNQTEDSMNRIAQIALAKSIQYKRNKDLKYLYSSSELKILIKALNFSIQELNQELQSTKATEKIGFGLFKADTIVRLENKRNFLIKQIQ